MISTTEDELLDALTWCEDSYTFSEFVTEFPLPQVVKVVRGHDGGTDSSTLGYGEVLTIHALRETRILAAEDKNGNALSVGLDFPDEFQILPQVNDCSLDACGVFDLASIYHTVKYLEVIQAHYGTGENIDTVNVGEILEILDIHKPNKPEKTKVHVLDLESNQKSTLTSSCSARFRPLLDWKKYKAPELKTHQFGLPVRVRFMDTKVDEDAEFQRLISNNPDINVINEKDDIIVITTTVSSDPDFKFAFEIPKDLEIKVAVAEGFSNGAKHYTDIVTSLNERFNVTQFMTNHRAAPIKRRDVIIQHDYDSIKEYIIEKSISSPVLNESEPEPDGPPLPPRFPIQNKSNSFDIPPTFPPKVPERPTSKRKNSAPEVEVKPVVARRPRSVSQNQYDSVHSISLRNSVQVPPRRSIVSNDPSLSEVKDGEHENATMNIVASSPIVPEQTDHHPKSRTERKNNKPSPPPKPFKNPPSTNGPAIANNPFQAELKEIMKRKRSFKSSIPPLRHDENARYLQTSSEASNAENKTSQPKNVKSPVKVPEGKAAPSDTQTTTNGPAPPSQANENENTQSEAQRNCPKLPPRQRSMPEDCSSNFEGNSLDKIPEKVDQVEDKDRQMVVDEESGTYVPKLPPKSPARARRDFNDSPNYVQPIRPVHRPPEPVLPPKLPSTPPPKSRGTVLGRFNRPGTLPKDYRFGENPLQKRISEEIYDEPFVPPVMSVAPNPRKNPVATIPLDLSGLGITEVSDILKNLNIGQYAEIFETELIDGNLLKELKDCDLVSLQMAPHHRTKLLNFIKGWRPNCS